MSVEFYPSVAKIKRNGVYQNLPGFVVETGDESAQQMIATEESSNVAQYRHDKGDYFILDGTLYKATATINEGDNIVVGTNCDVAVLGDDVAKFANSIIAQAEAVKAMNGDNYYTFTPFTGTKTPASGLTAKLENGKMVLYGTARANRRWVCLNGQDISATTVTAFSQTLAAGTYKFNVNVSGFKTGDDVQFTYTTSTFGAMNRVVPSELNTDVPIMIGLWLKNGMNYGTQENPTYVEIKIDFYPEKANKETLDDFMESPENLYFRKILASTDDLNDLTDSGWYSNTASNVPANAPYTAAFKYIVLYKNATAAQIAILSSSSPNMYYRCKTSSGWTDWVLVPKPDTRKLPTFANVSALFTDGVLTAGTYTLKGYTSENSPIMVKMQSMYSTTDDSDIPYVTFESRAVSGGRLYFSHKYEIDSDVEYKQQEWRIPNNFITDFVNIIITVPEGSTLAVKSFDCKYVPYVEVGNPKILFHAHRGLEKFWPSETYNSVLAAAEMGFKSCIVIPKFTSDGVAVCFHNDGGASSPLKAYLKNPDGSEVEELQDTSVKISDFTYAELMQWSMGVVKANAYADEKILKMDDFLAICAKTGMRPIFSIHPTLTADQWSALKVLVDKYGLANQLSVKDGDTITWTRVINAFGDGNVYSIICLSSTAIDAVSKISSWRTSASAPNTRVDVEWMHFDPTDNTYVTRTQEALAAGHIVSAVLDQDNTGNYIKACIENGITEFTNERHCSMGLNW